ncbi:MULTISPECIES: transporter substrate-binding domain-containing protein [Catenuloplanes]|uniref:Glutamate transport system substrate-binding protein n=1 Tax=Catenuloplanes niger TaxID=587534 RepID=A0AAE3ZVM1_9ACTN|nr:transporter substrate-binding domain-containing protein [Catenuloplanes niger]MDR7325580.1 glutamate transport system substrate-binding protein [Catenuloplanes niger]
MRFRFVLLVGLCVLAVAIAMTLVFVGRTPSVEELREEAGLNRKDSLKIGVKDDQPGLAERRDGSFAGFDIDIAYMVAEDLGFGRGEVKFYSIESEDRERMQAKSADGTEIVDLVVASFSITREREDTPGVRFSAPYLMTEQSVLTRDGEFQEVATLAALRGRRVCTLATATSEGPLYDAGVVVQAELTISKCVDALKARTVDAISTDATILAGIKARNPGLTHWDIGLKDVEAYGINVGQNDALLQLVNLSLWHSREDSDDSRWEEAFERHLKTVAVLTPDVPIAQPNQPEVEKPAVREWFSGGPG